MELLLAIPLIFVAYIGLLAWWQYVRHEKPHSELTPNGDAIEVGTPWTKIGMTLFGGFWFLYLIFYALGMDSVLEPVVPFVLYACLAYIGFEWLKYFLGK